VSRERLERAPFVCPKGHWLFARAKEHVRCPACRGKAVRQDQRTFILGLEALALDQPDIWEATSAAEAIGGIEASDQIVIARLTLLSHRSELIFIYKEKIVPEPPYPAAWDRWTWVDPELGRQYAAVPEPRAARLARKAKP